MAAVSLFWYTNMADVTSCEHTLCTVKPRFTNTRLIRTPHYYAQLVMSLGKESPYILTLFNPLNTSLRGADAFFGSCLASLIRTPR